MPLSAKRYAAPLTGVLLTLFCLAVPAQKAVAQNETVAFPSKKIVVMKAFDEIERQTDFLLSYNHTGFDLDRKVSLSKKVLRLNEAMKQILRKTNRDFFFEGRHIVIIPGDQIYIPVSAGAADIEPGSEQTEQAGETEEHARVWTPQYPVEVDNMKTAMERTARMDENFYYAPGEVRIGRDGKPFYTTLMPWLAVKTNLLYGIGTLTPNLRFEIGIAPKSTIDIGGSYNGWDLGGSPKYDKKFQHWHTIAEYRYWFCERFNGHFIGAHGFFGHYHIIGHEIPMIFESHSDRYAYKGTVYGGGISYGYQWMLGKKWNLEVNAGVGIGNLHYDKWNKEICGERLEKGKDRTFVAPTRLGITISYIIR